MSARNNILYLSYDGMTDQLGQSQVLPYLIGIAAAENNIHLISFEKANNFTFEKQLIQKICDNAGITWHPLSYTSRPPVISSIYDLLKMRKKATGLHKQFGFHLIHCRSYLPGLIGMYLKKKYGTKFLFDIRGFWADERIEGGLWNKNNLFFNAIYHFFKFQEKKMFNAADGLISLTQRAVPIIQELKNRSSKNNPLVVIPCCTDTQLFDPNAISIKQRDDAKKELGINSNEFVLCYLGGIGTWYLAGEMMDFFKRLLIRFPEARFQFITKENPKSIFELAEKRNIDTNKLIIKSSPRKLIPYYLSTADVSLYFIMNSFSKQASSPTKQGEVMSMGLPLICNEGVGDSSGIVARTNTGYIVKSFSEEGYDKIVNQIKYPVSKEEKMRIRQVAIDNFSLEDGIKSYLALYRTIFQE